MPTSRTIVVGAGIGGLATAIQLAASGLPVTVLERADTPGGKMREVQLGGRRIDVGPTVFTMRWVFDELFAEAGASLSDHLRLQPLDIIARHAWSAQERLDLFADPAQTFDAIGNFAGLREANGFRAFCEQARIIYETLEEPFIRSPRPSILGLVGRCGVTGLGNLKGIKPYDSLWGALGQYFRDPRLRQLFGRYSTYCGSSPFAAPATLMLIAHVEQQGVWAVEGGMHQVAQALARVAQTLGVTIEYGMEVTEVLIDRGRAMGVRLASGDRLAADAVVFNGDPAALTNRQLGTAASKAVPKSPPTDRSLSAITWALAAETDGFPLTMHNVFFARDYAAEFEDIFQRAQFPREGTVYVCAQDRSDPRHETPQGSERLLCLMNAPARGDLNSCDASEIERCEQRVFSLLERCGLRVHKRPENSLVTTPAVFDRLFPATGGALYGQATHGWKASFNRPASRTRIPRLYLAGGGTHPGAGVPMAAMSGRLAAASIIEDLRSTSTSTRTAISGGMSTH